MKIRLKTSLIALALVTAPALAQNEPAPVTQQGQIQQPGK